MSEHRIVTAPGLAPPSGYAHAVVATPGWTVYLGGQTALGPAGKIIGTTMAEQFDVAAANVVTALAAAGGRPRDLVALTIYVTDMAAYRSSLAELGEVYQRHFGKRYVASALFGVTELFDQDAMVELVGVAVLPEVAV
ncbi:MAG TPA: RidA family protein [Jiangellaceae bacterium]